MTPRRWKKLLTDSPDVAVHLEAIARIYSKARGVSLTAARKWVGIVPTRRAGTIPRRVFFADADPSRL